MDDMEDGVRLPIGGTRMDGTNIIGHEDAYLEFTRERLVGAMALE